VRLLTSHANLVWRVDAADGARFLLRIGSPRCCHGPDETRSELAWLRALRRDADLPVPEPVAARDGSWLVTEPRTCCVFRWVEGPDLAERLSAENVRRLGELAARLHAHARTFVPPEGFRVRRHDRVFPWSDPAFPSERVILFDDAHGALFPAACRRTYETAIEIAQRAIDDVLADGSDLVMHGDLHPWNVKVRPDGELAALDFEDLMWGRPILDLATTLYYLELEENGAELGAALRAGYEENAPWPEARPGVMEALRAGRALVLANWVLSSPRAEDRELAPEFMARVERRLRDWLGI